MTLSFNMRPTLKKIKGLFRKLYAPIKQVLHSKALFENCMDQPNKSQTLLIL